MWVINLTILVVQGKDAVDCSLGATCKHGNLWGTFVLLEFRNAIQQCDCEVPLRSFSFVYQISQGVCDKGDILFCAYTKMYKQTFATADSYARPCMPTVTHTPNRDSDILCE